MCARLRPLIICLLVLLPASATAADDDAYDQMIELSTEAAQAVERGDHRIGAAQFRLAYEIYPDPILLNNELVAWFHAGDCNNALTAAEAVLASDELDDDDKINARAVDIDCHLQLAEEAIDDEQPGLATDHLNHLADRDLDADDRQRYDNLRVHAASIAPHSADPQDTPSSLDDHHASSSNRGAWLQIVGGVAVAGLGFGLHTVALERQAYLQDLADTPGQQDLFEAQRNEWESSQSRARWAVPALYGVGALAVGSGIYFLRKDTSLPRLFGLQPAIDTDHVGLSVTQSF